jgi:hypothetical protein
MTFAFLTKLEIFFQAPNGICKLHLEFILFYQDPHRILQKYLLQQPFFPLVTFCNNQKLSRIMLVSNTAINFDPLHIF